MKKSYKKIYIIELILFIVLLFNSFFKNILSNYFIILFMVLALILFKINFNFEKDKHSNVMNTVKTILIYLIIVLVIYFAIGIVTGFARNGNYYTKEGFITFLLPIILLSVLNEFFRYQVLQKSEGNIKLIILTTILLIFVNITNTLYHADFSSGYNILVFVGLYLLPSIGLNLCSTYICIKAGYKPSMMLNIILGLYMYLLPILPNYSEYMKSIFDLFVPLVLFMVLLKDFRDVLDLEVLIRGDKKKNIIGYSFLFVLVITLTYFTSGYFKYTAVAIASGSMHPTFDKGSVVIVKSVDKKYDKLEIGDILAFRYENRIIVHRIIRIEHVNGEYFFYTKGDANEDEDNWKIEQSMVMGTVSVKIPFIGYPTVWLSQF